MHTRSIHRITEVTNGFSIPAGILLIFWQAPPGVDHLIGFWFSVAIGSAVLSSVLARSDGPGRFWRRVDALGWIYLACLYFVAMLLPLIWISGHPSRGLAFWIFLFLFGLGGELGRRALRSFEAGSASAPSRSKLRLLLACLIVLAFAMKMMEAHAILTGGAGFIAPFTGLVFGVLPWVFLLQTLALLGLTLKLLRRGPSWLLGVAGLVSVGFMIVFSLPMAMTSVGVAEARRQFERAFGAQWEQASKKAGRIFLASPFDAATLYVGLDLCAAAKMDAFSVEHLKEIPYKGTDGCDLHFNVFRPRESPSRPHGVPVDVGRRATVIFIHGGGWVSGNTGMADGLLNHLASQGYVVFDVQYRLMDMALLDIRRELGVELRFREGSFAPKKVVGPHRIPDMVEDIGDFTKFISDPANDRYGADLSRVVFVGQSAGAQLAGVAGFGHADPYFEGVFSDSISVKAVVLYFTPDDVASICHDAHPMYATFGLIPGSPSTNPEAFYHYTPSNLVNEESPACILFHGTVDKMVPPGNSERIRSALTRAGVPCVLVKGYFGGHAHDLAPHHGLVTRYFLERFLHLTLQDSP